MIKNIINNFKLVNSISRVSARNLASNTSSKTSAKKTSKDIDDEFQYQNDDTSGIKNLEKLGLAKPYWSWPQYNRVIYPPTEDGKPSVTPFVHHMRTFIKYSPQKLWYPAFLIRGMSIDEAIKQLSFHKLKGAEIIKETLLEAQELAVKEHNIEFKSNLWISYSTCTNAIRVKGVRKHMGTRMGVVTYKYSHYYVRLEEGKPPANFASTYDIYEARAKDYIEKMRKRSIYLSI